MKRVLHHPAPSKTGKQYWRSLGELSDTPEFRNWLEREFPAGAAEIAGDEVSRRSFLKLMGASMALAGFGLSSCRKPERHLVPFTKSVEWTIPGKPLYYATAMPRRYGAMPLVVSTVDGRPIKIEGNPLHPDSNGATDAFAQASLLDLYDPSRSQRFVRQNKLSDRAAFEKYMAELRSKLAANGGAGLAFLVEETHSPTRERLRAELQKQLPRMRWCVYDPLLSEAQHFSTQISFGQDIRVLPQFDKADVILALDSDFLDCGSGDLPSVRGFTARRRVREAKDSMNRLYVVENRYTLTGAMADHRLPFPASQIPAITHALAMKIATATRDQGLASTLLTLQKPARVAKYDARWLDEAAKDLMSKPGASLVVAGPHQPVVVQLMVYAINSALKNIGTTILLRQLPTAARTSSILQLAGDIEAGRIKQLFIFGGDPVYSAPRSITIDRKTKQPLDWAELQKRVPEVIRLGQYEDATSALSQWHIPAAHYLETWSDGRTISGSHVAIQPMILPLFGGLSELDLLWTLLGNPPAEGPQLIQETFRATSPPGDFDTAWNKFLHDGVASYVMPNNAAPTFNGNSAGGVAHTLWSKDFPPPTKDSPEIVLVADYSMDDGRYINNGWLQEMPDPITKLTWDNAAMMSPAFAHRLGVKDGDLIEVVVTDTAKDTHGKPIQRALVIASHIVPGHADHSVTIPLGYGRKHTGPVGDDAGFNGYLLRTTSNPHYIVADGKAVAKVEVKKTGGTYALATTQEHFSIEGRGLVREATLEHYRKDEEFVKKIAGDEELPHQLPTIYTHPKLNAPQQWGMAVDLNTCTGCQACVIACQAENNIPIVGKLQVSHGRAMHWIRIDRYYASAKPFNQDYGQWPENPEMVHEPMMCQHCENAPCETVCPVNATIHSEGGLNVMVYNRCIGTRYCMNNCPFKVRRFNYFDYTQRPIGKKDIAGFSVYQEYLGPLTEKRAAETIKLQKNPNVTVRMRGVMEKCTYCVQRIEEAKIAAHVRAGASDKTLIPRDSFTSACAQACPTEAIVFGDIADPETRVSKMKEQNRNYRLLEYLNVKARTSYLARIRNPNPKMPDAGEIAVASLEHEAEDRVQAHALGGPETQPRRSAPQPGAHNSPGGNP
ncbi:MAG TPA: TAT-variant-translocated molybdopterin oxidoreductase [Chthoniobacterales bacterium]|jgi:molybdopterin-containing oxidoreductase family iron-sulfur binding subunit|nr:TAT-variant-translocated molybdopterin oxidoreductase [Chthoniobacterales bacterium]